MLSLSKHFFIFISISEDMQKSCNETSLFTELDCS